jgi:hypothetical protein
MDSIPIIGFYLGRIFASIVVERSVRQRSEALSQALGMREERGAADSPGKLSSRVTCNTRESLC